MENSYYAIERVIQFIDEHPGQRPDLNTLSSIAGMSKDRFEKVFHTLTGLSPFRFLDVISCEYTKQLLKENLPVLDASLAAGFSGPGRLHDLYIRVHGVTPGTYKSGGESIQMQYGICGSPFGNALIVYTKMGITQLFFLNNSFDGIENIDSEINDIKKKWPKGILVQNNSGAKEYCKKIFGQWRKEDPINLHVSGTNFQINVWKALLAIPEGSLVSYSHIANACGKPKAVRATASAIGANPVSYLIPCHRVIRSSGIINQYRWGSSRKKLIIGRELAQRIV